MFVLIVLSAVKVPDVVVYVAPVILVVMLVAGAIQDTDPCVVAKPEFAGAVVAYPDDARVFVYVIEG